ncbi:hypothetical protein [Streptomyces alfalfae]|uniref:Uncharacterized protein n=1 Tax=Streptomyces alfalfae TaxID=1642299 RepID=A0A7T4PEQ7_9ACTN|nr:hypothetical protein [Streptomyces alfalfae]QQC88861.1 hypothetical protein I8755_10870 [Streptomyces alfalfae]
MGWTVLYIAFGCVALWLLGEVLLQYKARLRWRLLAFVGFLCVVIGVLLPSVWVIGLGAIAFATGQTYVTLSFRKGFSTGWALGGRPGPSKRRKASGRQTAVQEPTLQVSDLEYEQPAEQPFEPVPPPPAHDPGVYEPQPLPDDTGQYGVYDEAAHPPQAAGETHPSEHHGYDTAAFAGYDQQGYAYDENAQQQYAAYSDPYIGGQGYDTGQGYDPYAGQQQYAPYGGDTYGGLGDVYNDTPPGGVWVPQQRTTDAQYGGELPQEQPYPYGHGEGYDGPGPHPDHNEQQYRY